ncbi:FecR family protein [Chryseolinea serpens]|uniref:FecR family protein n=1 Tax=Chryseolinea serpens TaxID=947013 RepID=A0A1M5JXR4_9BACT|nr:FecR domain-containing protein [Chryseolinea serpens]SHG45324.1 FecR family protein [Chryseolinea serpens]
MDRRQLSRMIQRLKAGSASDEEKRKLEQFWQDALQAPSALDGLSEDERATLKRTIYANIQARINRTNERSNSAKWSPWMWGAAAAFLMLAVTAGLLYWNFNRPTEIRTEYGKREKVILPDNSEVTLNGNSTIRYQHRWNDASTREVWIEGEAFFKVRHTANNRKFIVHVSDSFNVEVLGTEFNVKNRAHEIQVMLVEGRVKLNIRGEEEQKNHFLAPGELATAMDKQPLVRNFVEHRQYTSWQTDTLVFNHTALREVAVMLKNVYGLETSFKNAALQDRQLTGELYSFNVDEILLALAETFDLDIERNGNEVRISDKLK